MADTKELIKQYLSQLTDIDKIAIEVAREHKIIEYDTDIALTNGYIQWLKTQ